MNCGLPYSLPFEPPRKPTDQEAGQKIQASLPPTFKVASTYACWSGCLKMARWQSAWPQCGFPDKHLAIFWSRDVTSLLGWVEVGWSHGTGRNCSLAFGWLFLQQGLHEPSFAKFQLGFSAGWNEMYWTTQKKKKKCLAEKNKNKNKKESMYYFYLKAKWKWSRIPL